MTEFTTRLTFTCPADMLAAGNELMAWIGWGMGDLLTFSLRIEDGNVPDYAVASGAYKPDFVSRLSTPLTEESRPAWGETLDLALAQQGQSALAYVVDERDPDEELVEANAHPATVTTVMKGVANGSPDDAPAWEDNAGEDTVIGDYWAYDGGTYMTIQDHTIFAHYPPDIVPALYVKIEQNSEFWEVGVQYYIDDVRIYEPDGLSYTCLQSHVSTADWTPPATINVLWQLLTTN